jgi:hypothetical protein
MAIHLAIHLARDEPIDFFHFVVCRRLSGRSAESLTRSSCGDASSKFLPRGTMSAGPRPGSPVQVSHSSAEGRRQE